MRDEIKLAHQLRTLSQAMGEPTRSVMLVVADRLEADMVTRREVAAATEAVCLDYCRWPRECRDGRFSDAVLEHCAQCPLENLIGGD